MATGWIATDLDYTLTRLWGGQTKTTVDCTIGTDVSIPDYVHSAPGIPPDDHHFRGFTWIFGSDRDASACGLRFLGRFRILEITFNDPDDITASHSPDLVTWLPAYSHALLPCNAFHVDSELSEADMRAATA